MSFDSLGLSEPLLKAIADKDYSEPSPIQGEAIPAILTGQDVMAAAQTGTGKTASFTLPLLERLQVGPKARGNQVRALVLTPTRELAAQVADSIESYGKYMRLRSDVVFGGVKINPQMMRLRRGTDILVATPGRLLDLYQQNAIKFNQLEVLILDEADRMLDMGFIHDIKRIIKVLPSKRQNLMFSATFSNDIRQLARAIVKQPVEISVTPANTTAERVKQSLIAVDGPRKTALLIKLIKDRNWFQVLVFSRTKHGANRIARKLQDAKISATAIHGNKSQNARTRALADFKDKKLNVLVATDIAARGIDIALLPQVVNFDLPSVPEDYVHRIGRTARANNEGLAVSLVCHEELKQLCDIQRVIGELIPRETIEGFEPKTSLPDIALETRPKRIKKPKKNKSTKSGRGRSGESRSGNKGRVSENKNSENRTSKNKSNKSQGNKSRSSKNKSNNSSHSEKPTEKSTTGRKKPGTKRKPNKKNPARQNRSKAGQKSGQRKSPWKQAGS